ncbi:hypothetical protein F52700_13609 [Fusarium sp. NRRL 52700]|nr:hypothetical protein F52700_13609 [Fusarium sp. NRRL 52700]
MQFTSIILLFPATSLASWPRQASSAEECTSTTKTLPHTTQISVYPTSTTVVLGCHAQVTGGGSPAHTTGVLYPAIEGQDGHTHSICALCDDTERKGHASDNCPPGFTVTTIIIHPYGEQPITSTATLPVDSAAGAQRSGSHMGNTNIAGTDAKPPESLSSPNHPPQESNTYTSVHIRPGSSLQTTVAGTGAEAGPGSEPASSTILMPASRTTADIVAAGRAPGNQATGSTFIKVLTFGIILPVALFV